MEIKRLFDYLLYQNQIRPNSDCISFKDKTDKKWKSYTNSEIVQKVKLCAQFLIERGVQKNEKVALISTNCPQWNIVDIALQMIGAVCVPLYPTLSKNDYEYIFNDAQIKMAFIEGNIVYKKVEEIQGNNGLLKEIISFEKIKELNCLETIIDRVVIHEELLEQRIKNISECDLATIIYTSGTTGNPKGVMLSHKNIVSNITAIKLDVPLKEFQRSLSFLPLCHSFERTVFYVYLANGIHIHYAESLDTIADNLKEVKPSYFTTVPRLLEKMYVKIIDHANTLPPIKKKLFYWALELGMEYEQGKETEFYYGARLWIVRKLVFSKWKKALGGNIDFIFTGAAPFQPRLAKLFNAAGILVLEGYGLTETSPVLALNHKDSKKRKFGTVGLPLSGVEIKLAEDGEILAKGPNIMVGYYNQKKLTDEIIDMYGWFHTGDIGEWDTVFLKITDRKKELFKTSGGKYIAPQAIENKMKESKYIEQIMIVGEYKKHISALIVPSFFYLQTFAKEKKINYSSNSELINAKEVIKLLESEVNELNKQFGNWEQIKKISLLANEWTVENGEFTPTLKPKRKVILEKYKSYIDKMYEVNENINTKYF